MTRAFARLRSAVVCLALLRAAGSAADASNTGASEVGNGSDDGRSRVPFVFFAGVEGVGHHWYSALFERCESDGTSKASLVGGFSWQRAAAVWASKMTTASLAAALATEAVVSEVEAGVGSYYAVNTFPERLITAGNLAIDAIEAKQHQAWRERGGMMSYPGFTDRDETKALKMPDMTYMAQALMQGAPDASQLRVCLVTRDPSAILRSVCDHRHYGRTCPRETALLVLGASVIATQIDELPPPPLVKCEHFSLEDVQGSDANALATHERLGVFLNLDNAPALAAATNEAHDKTPREHGRRLGTPEVERNGGRPGGQAKHNLLATHANKADLASDAESPERAALVERLRSAQAVAVAACERHGERRN